MSAKLFLKKAAVFAAGFLVVASIFATGAYFGYTERPFVEKTLSVINREPRISSAGSVDFEPFWHAWNVIDEKFAANGDIDRQVMVWGAIEGMVKSLDDPYTVFFPPVEKEMFDSQIRGDFEGVGMEIGLRKGLLTVIAPIKDSPAWKAGIKAGDKILKIDDQITAEMTVDDAVKLIRGPKGTTVTLTVIRSNDEEKAHEIKVVRDKIVIPSFDHKQLDNKIYLIRLFNFNESAANGFREALRAMAWSGSDKLIVDLRSNPGGYLEVAVDTASWWLPIGKVVARESFGDGSETIYRSRGYEALRDVPTVILINEGSASASEILAGALQEHGYATLVGAKTFGKGSVQELVPITSDTSLKVTIARWLTPNGRSISKEGLEPDVEVKLPEEDAVDGKDAQLNKAIEILSRY